MIKKFYLNRLSPLTTWFDFSMSLKRSFAEYEKLKTGLELRNPSYRGDFNFFFCTIALRLVIICFTRNLRIYLSCDKP